MPVTNDMAMMVATSIRKIALENVPRDSSAQPRSSRLDCGGDASV